MDEETQYTVEVTYGTPSYVTMHGDGPLQFTITAESAEQAKDYVLMNLVPSDFTIFHIQTWEGTPDERKTEINLTE